VGRICKNTIFAKGKEKNMEEILKIDTVDQYNKLFGFETRHPQGRRRFVRSG